MYEAAQPSRRLPVYILADRSGSMDGEPIVAVNQGMGFLKSELESDPRAVDMAWVSVISFGGDATLDVPLTEVMAFYPPTLYANGSTPLGAALRLLNQSIDNDLTLATAQHTGDYKPLVFLFTDGEPTDEWQGPAQEVKHRATAKTANIIAIGCGPQVNESTLRQISESVLMMDKVTPGNFKALFQWISMSVKIASQKAPTGGSETAQTTTADIPTGFRIVV